MSTVLDKLTLHDLPKKDKIISIQYNETIPQVLEKIFSNKILSAPIVDKKSNVIGCVGIIDIVLFSLNVCQSGQEVVKFLGLPLVDAEFVNFDNIKNYLAEEDSLTGALIGDSAHFLSNFSHQNLLQVLPPEVSFKEIVTTLSKVHRVAIEKDGHLLNYISQSEIVRFLKEKKAYEHVSEKSIKELHLGNTDVVHIKDTQRVVEAYKLMIENKVSGVAVVNEQKQLVGQISAQDIKCVSSSGDLIIRLYDPFPTYKQFQTEKNVTQKTIAVTLDATLSNVLDTLVNNRLHRVFVIGNNNHLERVITLTDLLKLLI
jgi:CBS domain-containing protein